MEEELGRAVQAEEESSLQLLSALATWRVDTLTVLSRAGRSFR